MVIAFLGTLGFKKNLSAEFVAGIKAVYTRCGDVRFMAVVLKYLPRGEFIEFLPDLLSQPDELGRPILVTVVQLAHSEALPLSPVELVVAVHRLEDVIELKTLAKAITVCLGQRQVYSQELLGATLQKLVESTPVPTLSARTVSSWVHPDYPSSGTLS